MNVADEEFVNKLIRITESAWDEMDLSAEERRQRWDAFVLVCDGLRAKYRGETKEN